MPGPNARPDGRPHARRKPNSSRPQTKPGRAINLSPFPSYACKPQLATFFRDYLQYIYIAKTMQARSLPDDLKAAPPCAFNHFWVLIVNNPACS